MTFDSEYISQVLSENFEDAKTLFLSPLIAIHYASRDAPRARHHQSADARALREALIHFAQRLWKAAPYDATCEDLFFYSIRILVKSCGEGVAGPFHTHAAAMTSNDAVRYAAAGSSSRGAHRRRAGAREALSICAAPPRHAFCRAQHTHRRSRRRSHIPAGSHRAARTGCDQAPCRVCVHEPEPARLVCHHWHRLPY